MMRRLAGLALAIAAAGGGVALGAVVLPRPAAHVRASAAHRVELRALYGPTGALVDVRRIETWRSGDRQRRRETLLDTGVSFETIRADGRVTSRNGGLRPVVVRDRAGEWPDDVDRRAARLRAALEVGWMRRMGEARIAGRRAVILRARRSSPVEPGWTVAVDPDSFAPIAGERRSGGRLVERRRLLVDERVPLSRAPLDRSSLLRARSVPLADGRLRNTDHATTRSIMTNRTTLTRALAALSVAAAVGGGQTATASATPKREPIHHWVIEGKTMAGEVGRTEGWQRGNDRHVLVGEHGGSGFPGCTPGRPQDWLSLRDIGSICGRIYRRGPRSGMLARQIMNPTELGELVRESIDRGGYEAAGEDVLGGRRVTVWREADRSGLEPEEERKLILTTYYLDAADGSFAAVRDDNVASGKTQEEHVVVDEVLPATRARLTHAGLVRAHVRSGKSAR